LMIVCVDVCGSDGGVASGTAKYNGDRRSRRADIACS
jgi:hypothetical protein